MIGIGTILNALGIVVGGLLGLFNKGPNAVTQNYLKSLLGAATAMAGLYLTWTSLTGSILDRLKQLAIVVLALILGRITGRLLHLQKASNRLGRFARERIATSKPGSSNRLYDGFRVCAGLFCVAPLGILGALQDGLSGYFVPLAIKAVIDGLAVLGFISIFGRGVMLSAIPVLIFQGTITLCSARWLLPWLQAHALLDPVNATCGLLIFSISLLIFEVRKVEVADYLPALCWAPALAKWVLS
jgi:uncharacterized protein